MSDAGHVAGSSEGRQIRAILDEAHDIATDRVGAQTVANVPLLVTGNAQAIVALRTSNDGPVGTTMGDTTFL